MKITIKEHGSRNSNDRAGHYWTLMGGCHFTYACCLCFFYPYIESEHCSTLRDRFISYIKPATLPYTFDTDDYPECLI